MIRKRALQEINSTITTGFIIIPRFRLLSLSCQKQEKVCSGNTKTKTKIQLRTRTHTQTTRTSQQVETLPPKKTKLTRLKLPSYKKASPSFILHRLLISLSLSKYHFFLFSHYATSRS